MPSRSPAQARMMAAVAHGWKKPGGGGPSQAAAEEFNEADTGGEMLKRGMRGAHPMPAQHKAMQRSPMADAMRRARGGR